ncbi:MAG: HAMP domain-containing histidine kinase [Bacteroidota bacterium]|nr:HAMP domain-containing histidine kinase [Bacteroidota bacterium]
MKRRIRSIFWLMVACMLGINGFQGYWLYNTYQLTASQFARTVREALLTVVQRGQVNTARLLMQSQPSQRPQHIAFQDSDEKSPRIGRIMLSSRGQGTLPTTIVVPAPLTLKAARQRMHQEKRVTISSLTTDPASVDTLARTLSYLIINDWAGARNISLTQLATAYHAELRQRGSDAPFVLDTLRPKAGNAGPAGAARAGYPLRTPLTILNPITNLRVWAAFQRPTFFVLRRMSGLLAGSVVLLVLTTACFWLMLSTILRQKKLSEVKNDFINNMTHELKTPLATVSAAVEALQNFGVLHDAAKTQTYLAISRTELQRLSDLVEKVLHIAVDERQPLALTPETVQPAALVAEIVARHQLQAAKPVQFDVQVDAAPVQLDRLHLGNVLNNLIDNAIKYSREAVTITIRGRQEATGWHLSVADNGPGIAPGYQEVIFDQFFRVPTGNLHPVKGFGLGLYYARQVVERHGGRLAVRSGPGRGSEFALWIPQG